MKEPTRVISSLDQEIIVVTVTTLTRLYAIDPDMVSLYIFYCYTAKKQSQVIGYTNKIKASSDYCRKGLHWGSNKFHRVKKLLVQHGFIEDIIRRDRLNEVEGHYIQINFLLNPYKDDNPSYNPLPSFEGTRYFPHFQRVGNEGTNADEESRNAEEEKKKTPRNLNSLSRGKKPIEHISYSNIIGQNQPNTIGNTPTSLSPLSFDKLYEVAQKKNVPLATVERLHETILNHIENGNKYKTKSVLLTLYTWINNGLSRGDIQTMSEEERMIFDMRSPSRLKKREALIKRMKEKELL
jgi:hypothetical protein